MSPPPRRAAKINLTHPPESPPEELLRGDERQQRQSRDEAAFSTGSSGADFIGDPGPGFDPRQAPPAPDVEPAPELEVLFDSWDEARIRDFLVLQGEVTHAVLRAGPEDDETWLHTERDLASIAPPLTRILNRYDVTRAAAAAGDEILLASAIARYGSRNYIKRRRLLAEQREQGPQPVTGRPAEPETGPEYDPEWQRVNDPMAVAPPALVPKGGRRR